MDFRCNSTMKRQHPREETEEPQKGHSFRSFHFSAVSPRALGHNPHAMNPLSLSQKLPVGMLVEEGRLTFASRQKWESGAGTSDVDLLAVEEPLEIRCGGTPLAVVMRTPGHDEELALGFALTEGIAQRPDQIERVAHSSSGEHADNVIVLIPHPSLEVDPLRFQRNLYTSSSCGICGKKSLEQALLVAAPIEFPAPFSFDTLRKAPEKLTAEQVVFPHCGALHGAGLLTASGDLLCVREDIGRHNAVDKVVGWAAQNKTLLSPLAIVVSGRASFEIIQKALFARISCVVAVGGVSSLAVQLAMKSNITLVGFAREDRMSIYSGIDQLS